MAVNLSPVGGVAAQFFSNNGVPLAGGKIFTYAAGTTTPQASYTTSQGNVAWTNPIVLDAAGRVPGSGEIWLTDGINYKFVLKDANDVLIATYDNISGINSNFVAYSNSQEIQTATAGQTVFTLTTMQYQPGTNSLSVFVDGVNQYGPGAQYSYVETDSTTVTFNSGLHVGAEVKFTSTQQQGAGAVDSSQVTYDPPFTGSVPTNVEAKLAQTVSVKDFGAVGDGVTDDTAAIQATIDYAKAGVNTVYFPAGTYKTSSSLTVTRSVNLIGAGAPCTTIKPTSALTGPCIVYGVVGNTPRPGTTSCEISGLTLDGSSTTDTDADGIRMWCSHLEIHNNSIREFEGYGIYAIEAYSNVVRQNWIYGNTKTNILVEGTGNAFVIQNNYILNSLEHGIWLQGSNKAIVQNNDIENNTLNGVKIVQSGVQAMRETYVGNNYFENNSGVTVEDIFVDALSSEITGLVIENNYHETTAVITVATIGGGCYINNNRNATLNFTNFSGSNVTCFGQAQGNYDTTIDNVAYSNFVQTDTTNGYQIFGRQTKFRVFSKNAGTTNEIFNCYTVGNNANGFLGGSLKMKQIAAADAQTDSVYVSSADGKLYFKDSGGVSHVLY